MLLAVYDFQAEIRVESEGEGEGEGKTHCSMETLLPMPPNSPWKPIRVGSKGLDAVE
jgi:hypothetical protein